MTISRYHVESNFFERAEEMRAVFDAHFDNPYESPSSWEYVFVEGLYTHLRARPRSWLSDALFEAFSLRLRTWCRETLGLVPSSEPRLHLMVEGCSLSLHSDFHNGAMGYVYSLTRWAQRSFRGGETLLLRDGIPNYKRHQVHGAALHESIPAHFNQLLVFDDRIVHATPQIEGNMDPRQGRLALVGHLRPGMPKVSGALREADVGPVLLDYQHSLREPLSRHPDVQGTVSYRLHVGVSGAVDSVVPLFDALVVPATGYGPSDAVQSVRDHIVRTLAGLRFPAAAAPSTVTLALLVPIPNLKPIELKIPHELPVPLLVERLSTALRAEPLELLGSWSGNELAVREPLDGMIMVDDHRVVARFSPPSWVPSQRSSFERDLSRSLECAVASPVASVKAP